MASQEEMRWSRVKTTAARWFARLEADERRCASRPEPGRAPSVTAAANDGDVPELDPSEVVEVVPAAAGRRR